MLRASSRAVRRARPFAFHTLAVLLLGTLAAPASAAEPQLSSGWRTLPVRIDGNDEEWRGRTVPFEKQRFALGLQNDGEALYLCLTTRDRVLATQIARQGLVVWLDPGPDRPKKHVFGVHFPIDPHLAAARQAGGRWPRDGGELSEWNQAAIGILGPEKDEAIRVPILDAGGILARAAFHGDVLVLEMKLPLKGSGSGPHTVAAAPGGTLRLELQTPEWRGPLPPARGPLGIGISAAVPGGHGVVGYPSVDATYLKKTDVKAAVRLATAF